MSNVSAYGTYFPRPSDTDRKGFAGSEEEGAITDDMPAERAPASKPRNRRASEGALLGRGEGKRVSGELRCDTCGKGYKHSSCLTKHMYSSFANIGKWR